VGVFSNLRLELFLLQVLELQGRNVIILLSRLLVEVQIELLEELDLAFKVDSVLCEVFNLFLPIKVKFSYSWAISSSYSLF